MTMHAFSWQNSLLRELALALLHFVLRGQTCLSLTPGYLLTSFFCILVPYDEKDRFSMLVLEGGVGIEPFNFSFFSIIGWRIDLNYCDIEWFALETNKDHSVAFEIAPKYCISDSSPKWPPNVCFYLLISRSC